MRRRSRSPSNIPVRNHSTFKKWVLAPAPKPVSFDYGTITALLDLDRDYGTFLSPAALNHDFNVIL
jgi:hypothetical protein